MRRDVSGWFGLRLKSTDMSTAPGFGRKKTPGSITQVRCHVSFDLCKFPLFI